MRPRENAKCACSARIPLARGVCAGRMCHEPAVGTGRRVWVYAGAVCKYAGARRDAPASGLVRPNRGRRRSARRKRKVVLQTEPICAAPRNTSFIPRCV